MTAAIQINNLSFGWQPSQPTLDIPQWHVDVGDTVLLRGASGSGKSTLLSLLAGINTPQQGQIKIFDTDISQLSSRQRDKFRADHIGYIFQQFNLLPYLSALDNVLLGVQFSKRRNQRLAGSPEVTAREYLTRLGLVDKQQQQPAGQLSVGQQQRVAAARSLIGAPELLIADEPTSALDADRRDAFIELLLELSADNNTTVLFVTHDSSLSSLFKTHIELNDINRCKQEADNV